MLQTSANGRFLAHDDGRPFFYLADTAWELFHRLTFSEAEYYLRDRAANGFTVIQAVVLAELGGLTVPNWRGHLPLRDNDPTRPIEAYFEHVDAVIALATSLGLHIGLLPTWGDKWNTKWGMGPEIFTPENARIYGEFLGGRYADSDLIWILGGDRPVETEAHRLIIRAMADGLRAGDGGSHLIGFHTWGPHSSTEYVADETWIDLHMIQSGHLRNRENWRTIEADYALTPSRPVMDAEPGYEDSQNDIVDLQGGYLDDYDVRKAMYWSLFAGAHGHTYGCWPIWCMWRPGLPPILARRPWYEALPLPGSRQVRHAKALLLSRPYFERVPDQSLVASASEPGTYHVQATRDASGRYVMAYIPATRTRNFGPTEPPGSVVLDLTSMSGAELAAWWFDPRTGIASSAGDVPRGNRVRFTPPLGGPDWVLVVDDAACGFPPPGQR